MDSGRAAQGSSCNAELVGHFKSAVGPGNTIGTVGGFKVHRYVDSAGNECAYYDSQPLFGTGVLDQEVGVVVLDMADPANPVNTARLVTPAMLTMHEALVISETRGMLISMTAATQPIQVPSFLDIYDLTQDCRQPQLISSTPIPGVFAHESGLSPDGNVFWVAMTSLDYIWAVDISDPALPAVIFQGALPAHGMSVSGDGNRLYSSFHRTGEFGDGGLLILDTAEVMDYVGKAQASPIDPPVWSGGPPPFGDSAGVPQVTTVARLAWNGSIPQNSVPFTSNGRSYLLEFDEYGGCSGDPSYAGAARIIDINDEANPFVLSNMRLEVHDPTNFDEICNDPGATNPLQGYSAHYCHIPTRIDPTIVACSMNLSGLRVFDITDLANPVETAYFNAPVQARPIFEHVPQDTLPYGITFEASNWAMSAPAFAPERKEIWYTDAFQGFYAVRLTNDSWPKAVKR